MDSQQQRVSWCISQLRRCRWQENEDPSREQPLTYAAHKRTLKTLSVIETFFDGHRLTQDIEDFKVAEKDLGKIWLQWYGPVFELDLDIDADGSLGVLLCPSGAETDRWFALTDTSDERLIESLKVFHESL